MKLETTGQRDVLVHFQLCQYVFTVRFEALRIQARSAGERVEAGRLPSEIRSEELVMERPELSLPASRFGRIRRFTSPRVEIDRHARVAGFVQGEMLEDDLELIGILVDHRVQLAGVAPTGRALEVGEDDELNRCMGRAQDGIIGSKRDVLFRCGLELGQDLLWIIR